MYDVKNMKMAQSVAEAVQWLHDMEQSMVIAGGSDVLIKLREGHLKEVELISIFNIKEMECIYLDEAGTLHIGARASFSRVEEDPVVLKNAPTLAEACAMVGGPQIRNIGTIGGNVANAATSADSAATLCCHQAKLVLESVRGRRVVPISEFYTGPGKSVRERDELLTEILIDRQDYDGFTGKYIKYAMRNAMDIATLATTALVKLDPSSKVLEDVRIGYGVAGPTPLRAWKTEAYMKGKVWSQELLEEAGRMVLDEVHPRDSWRASKEFRMTIIEANTKRALRTAVERRMEREKVY